MPFHTLQAGKLRASIAPELGAGIADLSILGPSGFYYPLMRRAAPQETNASLLASFIMAPWANRIRNGSFSFGGKPITLRTNTGDAMAQHGDVRKRPWSIVAHSATAISLEYNSRNFSDSNWPWSFRCKADYSLDDDSLRVHLAVTNTDTTAFPAGCGHHPYFSRRLWDDNDILEVEAPVNGRYPVDSGCAIGPAAPDALSRSLAASARFPDEHIDAVFSGFTGRARLRWPKSRVTLTMHASPNMTHLVVFAPHANGKSGTPLPFVAVEPQTQANDGFNLENRGVSGTGTQRIEPGASLETDCRFEIGQD